MKPVFTFSVLALGWGVAAQEQMAVALAKGKGISIVELDDLSVTCNAKNLGAEIHKLAFAGNSTTVFGVTFGDAALDHSLIRVDATSCALEDEVDIGGFSMITDVAIGKYSNLLYVTTLNPATLVIFDLSKDRVQNSIPLHETTAKRLALVDDESKAFVVGSNLAVVDIPTANVTGFDFEGDVATMEAAALDPQNAKVVVTNSVSHTLDVFDTTTDALMFSVDLKNGTAVGVGFCPGGVTIYAVGLSAASAPVVWKASVADKTIAIEKSDSELPADKLLTALRVSKNTGHVFVSDENSTIYELDGATLSVLRTVDLGDALNPVAIALTDATG